MSEAIGRRGFIAAALLGGTAGHVLGKLKPVPTADDLPPLDGRVLRIGAESPDEARPCSKCGEVTYPYESHDVKVTGREPDFYWVFPVLCFDCAWPS
jgi:hypothetical protein